jgi:uncharacterized protein YkwD
MLSSLTVLLSLMAPWAMGDVAASGTTSPTAPKASAVKEKSSAKAESPRQDSVPWYLKKKEKIQAAQSKDKDPGLYPIEVSVVSLTNEQRKKFGLPPLEVDKSLMQTARTHCGWMTRNHVFQHGNFNVAENIAMGQHDSGEVVRAWMNSSGHRANILNPFHRRIGVSAYRTKDGTIYWCQQFRN